ncbi:MAG: RNA methyltransferase [Candidatus Pacebacteria bacterium]|nr:RNA methyltransferase [Candidatus Paceibacterota bacterium]
MFYLILDNIRSLQNIGSIFRTADALKIDKIYLCGISGKPPHPKISKTALGAEKNIPFEYHFFTWQVIEKLKKQNFQIIALEKNKKSKSYLRFKPRFPLALILGNEIKGVSESALKRADKIICLPMKGKKESLNVSVAFGIAGYYLDRFR